MCVPAVELSHTYARPGLYSVVVTARNQVGSANSSAIVYVHAKLRGMWGCGSVCVGVGGCVCGCVGVG